MGSDDPQGARYDRIGRGYASSGDSMPVSQSQWLNALGMPKQLSMSVRERVRTTLRVGGLQRLNHHI
jgi:hypothetical protein